MTAKRAMIIFFIGFIKAIFLTAIIQIATFYGFYNSVLIIIGIIGGIMTLKQYDETSNN